MSFMMLSYLASFVGCGILWIATVLQLRHLRTKLKQFDDDTTC